MMKKNIILIVFLIFITQFSYSQKDSVKVTYIANEGFLIEIQNKKILVDAYFGNEELNFCDIPLKSVQNDIENAKGIFSDVNILTASHNHCDHFDASVVASHLLNNNDATFISTQQSLDMIKTYSPSDYDKVKEQLMEVTPAPKESSKVEVDGVKLTILRLNHNLSMKTDTITGEKYNKHENVQNLGIIFEINGYKIFHSGDANSKSKEHIEVFKDQLKDIDIAFFDRSFFYPLDGVGLEIVRELINPKHVVLMHIRPANIKYFNSVANALQEEPYSITVFNKQMDIKKFDVD